MLALSEEGDTVIGLAEEPLPRCEIRSQTQKKKRILSDFRKKV